jgi:uncharacterized protein YjbI with pentapeptide repeats
MSRRKLLILGVLFAVGLVSFLGVIATDSNVTLSSALLALGTEGLKTAVLFFLVDYLISDHEQRLSDSLAARDQIRTITEGENSVLGKLIRKTSPDGGPVKLDLASGSNYSGVVIQDIDWIDSNWIGADISSSDFKTCRYSRIKISASDLSSSLFENCVFKEVDFGTADLSNALFSKCEFMKCTLQSSQCANTRFSRCEFWIMTEQNFPQKGALYPGCLGAPS